MFKRYFCIIVLIFSGFIGFSQSYPTVDSLKAVYDKHIENKGQDSITVKILRELYEQEKYSEPYQAILHVVTALDIYTANKDKAGVALMYRLLGDNYFFRENYTFAMDAYTKSLDTYFSLNQTAETAYGYLKIGETYLAQKLDKNASSSFDKANEIFKSINDKRGISFVLDKYALVSAGKYEEENALVSLNKSLEYRERLKDSALVALSYENIGDLNGSFDEYSSAFINYQIALEKYSGLGEKLKVAEINYKIAELYLILKDYQNAKNNYDKAILIFIEKGIIDKVSETENRLSKIALETGDYKEALRLAEKSLGTSQTLNITNQIAESFKLYSEIYSKQEKHKLAYKYLLMYTNIQDSMIVEKLNNQSNEMQVNLDTQKKEQEIEVKNSQIEKDQAQQRTMLIGMISLFIVLGFVIFFGYYFYKTNKKTKEANRLLIEKNDEISRQHNEISRQKDELQKANEAITKQKDEIENKNEKITSSINYASRIQRAMLPKIAEIREKLPEVFVMLSPREAVSGDFIWYGTTKDNRGKEKIIIAAVDCTGHGVPGAFMSMIGDAYLNQIVYQQRVTSPELILEELHKGIRTSLQQDKSSNTDGMDMALVVIDKEEKYMQFAGAKNPIFYIQNEQMEMIKGSNYSIGGIIREENVFGKHTIDISKPTVFYLYSDGFQDQFGLDNNVTRKYMAKHFRNFLFKIHQNPIEQQAGDLAIEFDTWRGKFPQMDDLLIIGVKIDCSKL